MLYIRPFTSEDNLPDFLEAYRAGSLSYIAFSGKEPVGYIFYRREGDGLFIEEVESGGDDALFDGLVRAVCDAAVQSGSDRVRFSPAVSRETLAKLGVPLDGEGVLTGLSAFLRNCKHCKSC